MVEKPNYYSILTADVRYDPRLTDSEKILFSELTSLTNKTGECWASNEYFTHLYQCSDRTISRRLDNLERCGYIKRVYHYKEGTKYIEKRIIKVARISMTDLSVYSDNVVNLGMTDLSDWYDRNVGENNKLKDNNKYKENNISFDAFWKEYPRKEGKAVAEKKFHQKVKDEQTLNDILLDLRKRKGFEQWKDKKFIPNPSTYLNQERWKDEYEVGTTSSSSAYNYYKKTYGSNH